MIHFTRLNLLPYRELAREKKRKQFRNILLLAVFVVVVATIMLYYFLNSRIETQQDRNTYLQSKINEMSHNLKNIELMEKEKNKLLAQRRNLENLQVERFLIVKMMNTLAHITPRGVQLTRIEPVHESSQYIIHGRALSDNRVAMFLKEIGATDIFANNPVMNEIHTQNGVQQFKITVTLTNKIIGLDQQKTDIK
ncbi:MAG: hypothetical protein GKC53_00085 [Neisseriaceae bacterium]|nr:MAG: hypothetical protein GKC53_00085 [Neisseriaceae bacterium]